MTLTLFLVKKMHSSPLYLLEKLHQTFFVVILIAVDVIYHVTQLKFFILICKGTIIHLIFKFLKDMIIFLVVQLDCVLYCFFLFINVK